MTSDLLECVEGFEEVVSVIETMLPEVCNHSSFVFTRQPVEFTTGHALQIACREQGAADMCARGYALQKTPIIEDQRATYVRGDAHFLARRFGGLTKLFYSQKFAKIERRQQSTAQFFRGR